MTRWEETDEARLLDEIRAELERRVDLLGLRPTARAIGLFPMSLRGFLDGGRRRPQEKTVLKLLAWHSAQSDPDLKTAISVGADLLTRGLRDPALRTRLRRFLVEVTLKPSHERLDRLEAALLAPPAESPAG